MPFSAGAPTPAQLPGVTPGGNVGSVGGAVAHSTVVESVYSVYDPYSIDRLAFKRHGNRPGFAELMDILGPDYNRGCNAPTTGHYERIGYLGQGFTVGSVITPAGAAGANIIIAVGANDMIDTDVEQSGSAREASNIRVHDIVLLPGGKLAQVIAKNVTTDPHRLTLRPLDATIDLDDIVEADATYFVVTNAHAPGSGLPEGLIPRTFKYTNQFQIVKESVAISGTELTNEPFVQIKTVGESVFGVMNQDAMDRFNRAKSGALFWGEQNTNIVSTTTQIGYDVPVSWTEGFMPFRAANSYEVDYNPSAYTIDEFNEIAAILERENLGTRQVLSLQGNQYQYLVEDALIELYDASLTTTLLRGAVSDYNLSLDEWQPQIEEADWVAWLGFQGVRKSGFSFHFRMMHEFTAPDAGGADAYSYPFDAVYLPLSKVTDRKTGLQRASIGYEWKELPPYSRKLVYGTLDGAGVAGIGGMATTAVTPDDWRRMYMIGEYAFHGACPNKIVYHTQES